MKWARCFFAVTFTCLLASAQPPEAPTQALTLVKEAVAYAKQHGIAKLIEDTNTPNGKFHVSKGDDLYIFIYDDRGMPKASGYQGEAVIGKNQWDRRDPDGVMIIQKLLRVAKNQERGWVDYKYPNPRTNLLEQKTSYYEFFEGMMIGCGIYKAAD